MQNENTADFQTRSESLSPLSTHRSENEVYLQPPTQKLPRIASITYQFTSYYIITTTSTAAATAAAT